jgi:signal transduction histidine kinase
LEIKVEERTKELKETQMEKMAQMYRFAEFGRLSSGLFHDLINPLNALSLNIEKIKGEESKPHLDKAIMAAKKMEDFINAIRKQMSKQDNEIPICLNDEIKQVIEILAYKARKANVKIQFSTKSEIKTVGNIIKFNQIILNLIANAIDSCSEKKINDNKVIVKIFEEDGKAVLVVKDNGIGIKTENLEKIFEPFYTTKNTMSGIGLGLSLVKRIIEKDFGGMIRVKSEFGEGAEFTVEFPIKNI